jgi:hypothetical protein
MPLKKVTLTSLLYFLLWFALPTSYWPPFSKKKRYARNEEHLYRKQFGQAATMLMVKQQMTKNCWQWQV